MHTILLAWLARKAAEEAARREAFAAVWEAARKAVWKRLLERREQQTAAQALRRFSMVVRCDGAMEV